MTTAANDNWASGDAYEAYMGRWSRPMARSFLQWLDRAPQGNWLDVGCGTGALTTAICDLCDPSSVTACDPSEPFVQHARGHISDARASFQVAGAGDLPRREGDFDAVVSGLVLNFIPDTTAAVAGMRERLRSGGTVAAYVWDYSDGMEFLRHFWDEAGALDERARELSEGRRFPVCRPDALQAIFAGAGLALVETHALSTPTHFSSIDDYWTPFLRGSGPAPAFVASLTPEKRDELKERMRRRLPVRSDGSIHLDARAWAVRGDFRP